VTLKDLVDKIWSSDSEYEQWQLEQTVSNTPTDEDEGINRFLSDVVFDNPNKEVNVTLYYHSESETLYWRINP
jgi:hypothetical protein